MILVLALICAIAWWVTRKVLVIVIHNFVTRTRVTWDDILFERRFFKSLAHIVPALIVDANTSIVFQDFNAWVSIVIALTHVYIVVMIMFSLNALLNAIGDILGELNSLKDKPIRSYVQLSKIIFFIVGFVIVIAILLGKSPLYIIGGFGAATAVLLLLFKDTILGLVASVQMSAIDMVRVGDWISMDKYGADGDVIEINLSSVKVQNWDMTVTIIPSYSLISDSFKNWRGMQVSGGRRIKRHLNIKISSIKFVDDELISHLRKIQLLDDFIERRQAEIDKFNAENDVDKSVLINGRHMTNLGVFREYATRYIAKHKKLNLDMVHMVRHLQPNEFGLPIEIYCFSKDKKWENYESIMADIFDHLFAVLPIFNLEIFESPSGADFRNLVRS